MPFSLEGFIAIRNELLTRHSPVSGNRGNPICLYCGSRHVLQRITRSRSERVNGIAVEYEEDWYYANPVEHGHGGPGRAPPHPFVRPAFDARAEEAYGEIKRVLADEIMNRS